jgi:hypothetical protein
VREVPDWVLENWRRLPREPLFADDLGDDLTSRCLVYALKNSSPLEMLYAEPGHRALRTVRPRQLERVFNGAVATDYMFAYDESEAEDRYFRLDGIRAAWVPGGPADLSMPEADMGNRAASAGAAPAIGLEDFPLFGGSGDAEASAGYPYDARMPLDLNLGCLEITPGVRAALEEAGIRSVRELLQTSPDRLLERVRSLGPLRFAKLREAVSKLAVSDANTLADADERQDIGADDDHLPEIDGLGFRRLSDAEVASAYASLTATLEPRQHEIALARLFAVGKRPTLDDLGARWGVSKQRAKQLEEEAEVVLRRELRAPASAALNTAARALRDHVGVVCQTPDLEACLPYAFRMPDTTAPEERPGSLLLWMAGPYRQRGDWLVHEQKAGVLAKRTLEVVDDLMIDDLADTDIACAALAELDIREPIQIRWLDSQNDLRVIDDHVLRWAPRISDKAYAVLRHHDSPMTAEEIAAVIGGTVNLRSLKNQLTDDPRLQRVGKAEFGLPQWRQNAYTSISDEIADEIERQGGEASRAHLVESIAESRGVSATSIRAYLSSRRFMRVGRGIYRVASADEISAETRPMHLTRGCYRLARYWSVRVTVSSDTLRGSGTPVPEGFAAHFGVLPGGHRFLSSEYGPMRVAWGQMTGHLGSLRRVVESLGADEGDLIFVRAVGMDQLGYELVRRTALTDSCVENGLAASVAWGGLGEGAEPRIAVCNAIGFADPANTDAAAAVERLRQRRELELLPVFEGLE